LLFALLLVVAAIAPTLLWPLDPLATDPAIAFSAPSAEHPFGTDQSGRDVLARVLAGTRLSLAVGVGATAVALLLGLLIGTASGFAGRGVDTVLTRAVEVITAFPEFLLALVIVAIIGPGPLGVAVAISIAAVPAYARVARASTLVARRAGHVTAARVLGVGPVTAALRHVVPTVMGPLAAMATIGVGMAIVTAAGLAFLGLGAPPPTPEWGLILGDGRNHLARAWWIALFPGLAITATVLATNVLGRRLRRRDGAS
jgi:peptide/nickel transport system permease protein